MSHVKDDTDASIFQNSVFDWGSRRGSNNSLYGWDDDDEYQSTSSSRYAPRGISRILNINDLVDDEANSEEEDDDDDEIIAPPRHGTYSGSGQEKIEGGRRRSSSRSRSRNRSNNAAITMSSMKDLSSWFSSIIKNRQIPSPSPRRRSWWVMDLSTLDISRQQVVLLFSLVGIIIISCVGVGYVVVGPNIRGNRAAVPSSDEQGVVIAELEAGKQQEVEEIVGILDEEGTTAGNSEEELFKISERVVTACAESMLDVDMSECQSLCHSRMCCFEDETERYSCVNDNWKQCVAYAACENLLDDLPLDNSNYGDGGGRSRRRR